MKRFLVLFFTLTCSKAQTVIYPDEYDRIVKSDLNHNLKFSSPLYESQTSDTYVNAQQNYENSSLYNAFPKYWSDQVTEIISNATTKFALDMDNAIFRTRKNVSADQKIENIVFSPISLAGTMAIVLLAAGGKTFDEVAKILNLESGVDISRHSEVVHQMFGLLIQMVNSNKSSIGLQAKYASGIFIQEGYPIRPEFQAINQNVYKSEIISTDFHNHGEEAKNIVNKWVNDRTMGKISKILSSMPSPETDVILASALYFNGEWDQYFLKDSTRRTFFHIEPGKKVMVDMMYVGADFPFYEDKGLQIVGLPYKGLEVTMYVLLSKIHGANALKEFKRNLTASVLEELIKNLKNQTCIIGLPKMNLSSTLSLKRAFEFLGLATLFDPVKADLSLLSPGLSKPLNKPDPQTRAQDGFYFLSRNGESTQTNQTVISRKNYFRYQDKLGYTVEQWNNGYNIHSNFKDELKNKENEAIVTTTSSNESKQPLDLLQKPTSPQQQGQEKKKREKQGTVGNRQDRQNRPIDQDFLDVLNLQNLSSFGIDSLRNNPSIQNPGLYADDVLHRVEININEEGTEAAAATAVALERTGDQKKLIANRPFLFFIRHNTSRLIWFWGTVNLPTPNYPLGSTVS